MFNSGTNIVVVASSLAKDKFGPKVGSLGFALEERKMPSPIYINKEILLFPQRVIFTNFGFETKLRIEEKIIVGILPIPTANGNFDKEVDKLFAKICNNDLHHQKWQETIMNTYNWKCKPICFVVPNTNPKQIINGNDVIFTAWIKSVLKSNCIRNLLSETLSKNPNILKKKFRLNISIIEILLRMSANTEKFDNNVNVLLKRHRKEAIRVIKWMSVIDTQHNVITQMKLVKDILIPRNGCKFNRKRGIEIISGFIFSPLFHTLCIYVKKTKRKEVIEFMDNMAVVRAKSVNLLLHLKR